MIGSANMDRRSFDLNYENNILFYDPTLTAEVRRRQDAYLASSHPVTAEMVGQWPMTRRLWNNTIADAGGYFGQKFDEYNVKFWMSKSRPDKTS